MAVQIAKKPAPMVAAPVAKPVIPAKPLSVAQSVQNAPPAPPADISAETDAVGDDDDADASAKEPRKKRGDFATWEEFCDYKTGLAEANVVKWQERVALWQQKKVNKDSDAAVKAEKKAEKLIAAFIQVQMRMGVDEATIKALVGQFRASLAAAKPAQQVAV